MQTVLQELHYALRQLRQASGFALTAVLTLAVGIGGVTAVFSVMEAVMLRPLPYEDPGRLISLHESFENDSHELRMSAPDVLIFQRESKVFSGVGAFIGSAYELTGAGLRSRPGRNESPLHCFPYWGSSPRWGGCLRSEKMRMFLP